MNLQMLSYVAVILPAILSGLILHFCIRKGEEFKISKLVSDAVCFGILENVVMKLLLVVTGSKLSVFVSMRVSSMFIVKYMVLSILVGLFVIGVLKWTKIRVDETSVYKKLNWFIEKYGLYTYALILLFMNLTRCSNNDFWSDEFYSIGIVRRSIPDLIQHTALDVHPPLYYLILKCNRALFGTSAFVNHVTSLIPWILLVIFAFVKLQKVYGKATCFFFITMISMTMSALRFNIQVRMYSWTALFVFMAFIQMRNIVIDRSKKAYYSLSVYALLAAYSLYWGLVTVSLLYICLWVFVLKERKEDLKELCISSVISLGLYIPWLYRFLTTYERVKEDWWLKGIFNIKTSLLMMSEGAFENILLYASLLLLVYILWFDRSLKKSERKWFLFGCVATFGTLTIGQAVSVLIKPMWLDRSLYPSVCILWLILAIFLGNQKNVIKVACGISLLCIGCMNVYAIKEKEPVNVTILNETLDALNDSIGDDEIILTDYHWMAFNCMLECYYDQIEMTQEVDFTTVDLSGIEDIKKYLLVSDEELDQAKVAHIQSYGYGVLKITDGSYLGGVPIYTYELVQNEGE